MRETRGEGEENAAPAAWDTYRDPRRVAATTCRRSPRPVEPVVSQALTYARPRKRKQREKNATQRFADISPKI